MSVFEWANEQNREPVNNMGFTSLLLPSLFKHFFVKPKSDPLRAFSVQLNVGNQPTGISPRMTESITDHAHPKMFVV